jgi:hypothetical protein
MSDTTTFIIKSMPEADRQAILAAARRSGKPVGEWVIEATRAYIEAGRARKEVVDASMPMLRATDPRAADDGDH